MKLVWNLDDLIVNIVLDRNNCCTIIRIIYTLQNFYFPRGNRRVGINQPSLIKNRSFFSRWWFEVATNGGANGEVVGYRGPGQLVRIKGNLVLGRSTNPRGWPSVPVALLRGGLMKCNKSRVNANPAECISRIIQFISKRRPACRGPSRRARPLACTHIQMRCTRACVYIYIYTRERRVFS